MAPSSGRRKGWPVVFAEVAAGLSVEQLDAELDAAGDEGDLAGGEVEDAELGVEHEAAELGHEEEFAVGGVEEAVGHGFVGGVDVDGDAGVHGGVAVAGEGGEAVDEVRGRGGSGSGSQRSWLGVVSISLKGRGAEEAVGDALVGFVHDGGADAVGPGAAVEQAGRGEGAAAELFCVEAKLGLLGGVLADGEGAGDGLGGELVAEAGEVVEIRHVVPLCCGEKPAAPDTVAYLK